MKSNVITAKCRAEWNNMSDASKRRWTQNALARLYNCCPRVTDSRTAERLRVQAELQEDVELEKLKDSAGNHYHSRGCLGTWNGSWLAEDLQWQELVLKKLPEAEFLQQARLCPSVQQLSRAFMELLGKRCEKLGFQMWSYQFEASLKSEDAGRIHLHAFWHSHDKRPHPGTRDAWSFQGSMPMLRNCTARGRALDRFLDRGHFYCQCDKEGWLIRDSNYHKYFDFAVEQKWVIALWQRRKVGHEAAKAEIIQARGHTNSYLQEVCRVERLEEELRTKAEQEEHRKMLALRSLPFRVIAVVDLWKRQYSADPNVGLIGKEPRFKFLVLHGPSCFGKTQYAKSLWGDEKTLLVQCQQVVAPDIRNFTRSVHKCIIFDECRSKTVVQNKALFQANSDGVLLGQSACNEHAYWKYLYGIALVVCCNDWMEGIKPGSEEEHWLVANAIVYDVQTKLWMEPVDNGPDGELAL